MPEIKGPYREQFDPEAEALKTKTIKDKEALEKMEKEIRNEGKFSVHLPENIKSGDLVPLFEDALKQNIKPEDIVFYSLVTGILRYLNHVTDPYTKVVSYRYFDPDNLSIQLNVELADKKYRPTTIVGVLSTKADLEKGKIQSKEYRKNKLLRTMNLFEHEIQHIKDLIEKGVDKELEETYLTEIKEIRTSLKLLLDTIDDKLEEKK